MKRNYSFRTDKFSLFLFGVGAGLLSIVPAVHAQTQLAPLVESVPVIRSPKKLMTAKNWSQPKIVDADNLIARSPAILNRVIVNPELAKTIEEQQNATDSIRVDATAFNLDSKKQVNTSTSFVNQPEIKRLQPLKIPVNWTRLQPIKQPKQVSKAKSKVPPIVSPSNVATPELTETRSDLAAAKQIAASSEGPETAIPQASLAFLRKPMDIMNPTTLAKDDPVLKPTQVTSTALLQPINAPAVAEQASLAIAPTYDFQTPLPSEPVSLFVDGPDYLSLNQIGEYEIAIANSSSDVASVSRILLQVPNGVEIVAVQREAEINNQERTLSWSIDQLGSGEQQRIRFRVKSATARKADFPVTVSQDGRESQTVSQTTIIR